jgi:hypothetical protein
MMRCVLDRILEIAFYRRNLYDTDDKAILAVV